jgi:superfamily II RNA helicase
MTELLFAGQFATLTEPELASVFVMFVCETKGEFDRKILQERAEAVITTVAAIDESYRTIQSIEDRLRIESQMTKLKKGLIAGAFMWADGCTFMELMEVMEAHNEREGNIVRAFNRVINLLRGFARVCEDTENTELAVKFDSAAELVNRGIVNCPSLYLVDDEDL